MKTQFSVEKLKTKKKMKKLTIIESGTKTGEQINQL